MCTCLVRLVLYTLPNSASRIVLQLSWHSELLIFTTLLLHEHYVHKTSGNKLCRPSNPPSLEPLVYGFSLVDVCLAVTSVWLLKSKYIKDGGNKFQFQFVFSTEVLLYSAAFFQLSPSGSWSSAKKCNSSLDIVCDWTRTSICNNMIEPSIFLWC